MSTSKPSVLRSAAKSGPSPGLRGRTWKRFLRGPDPVLLDELYVPALSGAVRYDRCCAYFSSSVLSAAARGFAKLIERLLAMGDQAPRPAIRLIVNEELTAEDVKALTETGDTTALETTLRKRFKKPKDLLERRRLAMLGWLVKAQLLDVRVGVMRHGTGLVHAKFGIITDDNGDAVVFSGSGNESAHGLIANYERLEVSGSWDDLDRHREYSEEFDALWQDAHPDVHTVTLPEALRLKLVKLAPKEPPIVEPSDALARQKAAMIWRFIVEAPFLPGGETTCDATAMVDLWPHQRHVVEETANAWPSGRLLCDEVGMGKTIEAILVLRRLMAGRGVRRALLLLPAALLKQWQAELREKGGLLFPRLEGTTNLIWPDETTVKIDGLPQAFEQDLLLMSRETARTDRNLAFLLAAEPWDLLLLDEAHAARRREQVEGEFNSGNLLLNLLRQVQLLRRSRSILLLSATPMQTQPWEPWDLLSVLGEGGAWLADFTNVRDFYAAAAALTSGQCDLPRAKRAAELIAADPKFPNHPSQQGLNPKDAGSVARKLAFAPASQRQELATWLRQGSPLSRRMHRNTRNTLRRYHELGLLASAPARRNVHDVKFDYQDGRERAVYDAVTRYIEKRFEELEGEKPGKGFVMTIYRRRASSSPQALRESLQRRRRGLLSVASRRAFDAELRREDAPEAIGDDDLPETETAGKISAAFPDNPEVARAELNEVDRLLEDLQALGALDSKRDKFFGLLRQVTDDGRPALVFTEYTDTLEYLRDALIDHYGNRLGCYSGEGGRLWDGSEWRSVTKDAITKALREGRLAILICTDAASEGLNLQAAAAIINYDLPWNPSKIEQRIGRIDRIGQAYPVLAIVNLFLKDSVDEQVYRVLRSRCRLFEHFVGSMQPVLARARRMLMAGGQQNIDELTRTVEEVDADPLAGETYLESAPVHTTPTKAAVTREDIYAALQLFTGDFGPTHRKKKDSAVVEVSGTGLRKAKFTSLVEALEANLRVRPLCPLDPVLGQITDKLWRAGERLPLVVRSVNHGSFRSSAALWVDDDRMIPVESMQQLRSLVAAWSGTYPAPERTKHAETEAHRIAAAEVNRRRTTAEQFEADALVQQVASARLRLTRELGRFLVCASGSFDDLNRTFHQQMSRDIAGARRLRRSYDVLGEYPDWPDYLREQLSSFCGRLSENRRQARLLGSELDAALADPRWKAHVL